MSPIYPLSIEKLNLKQPKNSTATDTQQALKVAKDIGYPSTVAVDKEGSLLTAFYTDYESTFKKKPNLYRVLSMRWSLKDWLHPTILGSISDGKQLKL